MRYIKLLLAALCVIASIGLEEAAACATNHTGPGSCHAQWVRNAQSGMYGNNPNRFYMPPGHQRRVQGPYYRKPVYGRPYQVRRPVAPPPHYGGHGGHGGNGYAHQSYRRVVHHRGGYSNNGAAQRYHGGGGIRQSTAAGAAMIPRSHLYVSSIPCKLSNGSMGVVVKVKGSGETRCGAD